MLAAFLCCAVALATVPGEPFLDLAYEPALARARAEKKLLLVDFTASWCQPCKKMEKDTWAAPEVRAWLAEHALAIQVDVDKEPELAQRFRVEAMPTVVAMRAGEDFDRVVGYKAPESFLTWGRDVLAGKRASDGLLERSKQLRESTEIDARYDLARELARAGQHEEALVHYLWLWPATRTAPRYGGVRTSFMLSDMAQLARKHEPARKAFDEIFAALQAGMDASKVPTFETWKEWTAFCKRFDGNERIVAWYEKHRDEDGRLLAGQEGFLPELIVGEVFEVLIEKNRPRDAVRLYDDVSKHVESRVRHYKLTLPPGFLEIEDRERLEEFCRGQLIDDLGRLYAALLLAGRTEEAAAVAARLLATLDTPAARMGLVRHGLALVDSRPETFARWLDEAEAGGGDVTSLRSMLARSMTKTEHKAPPEKKGD